MISIIEFNITLYINTTHSLNSSRSTSLKLQIQAIITTALEGLSFELKDRDLFTTLPNIATITATELVKIMLIKNCCNQFIEDVNNSKDNKLQVD